MSREAFEAWVVKHGALDVIDLETLEYNELKIGKDGKYHHAYVDALWEGWSARDAELAAKDARIAKLEAALRAVKDAHGQNILTPNCLTNLDIYEIIWGALRHE